MAIFNPSARRLSYHHHPAAGLRRHIKFFKDSGTGPEFSEAMFVGFRGKECNKPFSICQLAIQTVHVSSTATGTSTATFGKLHGCISN